MKHMMVDGGNLATSQAYNFLFYFPISLLLFFLLELPNLFSDNKIHFSLRRVLPFCRFTFAFSSRNQQFHLRRRMAAN